MKIIKIPICKTILNNNFSIVECIRSLLLYNNIYYSDKSIKNGLQVTKNKSVIKKNIIKFLKKMFNVNEINNCSLDKLKQIIDNNHIIIVQINNIYMLVIGYDTDKIFLMNPMDEDYYSNILITDYNNYDIIEIENKTNLYTKIP